MLPILKTMEVERVEITLRSLRSRSLPNGLIRDAGF